MRGGDERYWWITFKNTGKNSWNDGGKKVLFQKKISVEWKEMNVENIGELLYPLMK